jgi:retron-type reverse transcriptase
MRTAETLLAIIQDRGKRRLPLEDVYRQLYNPAMYLRAYARLSKNDGALTRGITSETVDGMSQEKIAKIIEAIRYERWHWTPVRRKNIPKPKGGTRPLGMPTWSDKLVQEVIRSMLEAYYDPQFSEQSHGFRPHRGCHTALTAICKTWTGTRWYIEGDIKGCFDSIDHNLLMAILREKIHDNRFLRLMERLLKAGYCEDWKYHPSPQWNATRRDTYSSYKVANPLLEFSTSIPRTQLRPSSGEGFLGAPLQLGTRHDW